jgi:hypothetical protein
MVPYLFPLCTTSLFQGQDSRGPLSHRWWWHGSMYRWKLLDEFDEFLPPGVISVGKQLFSKRFQVVNAYHFDGLLDRLASILVDLLDIKVLGFHAGRCFRVSATDQQNRLAC